MKISQGLSRTTALRIGLAARALPEVTPKRLLGVLVDAVGLPLSEQKLAGLALTTLRTARDGEFAEIDAIYLKQALAYLKGEQGESLALDLPQPQPYQDGELPSSIRVAFASNSGERLDGHFGSCTRFLIYQVAETEARLIDRRSVVEPTTSSKDEQNAYRVSLVSDCHILYVISIGGPPAAKVIRAGIHPIKHSQEIDIHALLPKLQRVLAGTPPPWLAKVMGTMLEEKRLPLGVRARSC